VALTDAVDAVYERFLTIPNVGKVYNMIRNSISDAQFQQLFVTGNQVLAWQVSCEGSTAQDSESRAMRRIHDVKLYGYMSFKDGTSEPEFLQLLDTIIAAYDPFSLRQFEGKFDWSGPMQVAGPKFAAFGGKMVHFAILSYPVQEFYGA